VDTDAIANLVYWYKAGKHRNVLGEGKCLNGEESTKRIVKSATCVRNHAVRAETIASHDENRAETAQKDSSS
jgi:hypothetical protein